MSLKAFLKFTAIPGLLLIAGLLTYLSIFLELNELLSSFLIFLLIIFSLWFFEKLIPLKKDWKNEKLESNSDLKHLVFSAILFDALGKATAIYLALELVNMLDLNTTFFSSMNFWIAFIFANILGELLPYFYHRLSHKGSENSRFSMFLWHVHSIHHLPGKMNWFKTSVVHPVNMFLNSLMKLLPLALLGFESSVIFSVGILHVAVSYISHANIEAKTGILNYLIVTPKIHHFHHSTRLEEAKNFGNVLPFWDLVFGTYFNRKGAVDKVGVVKNPSDSYPDSRAYISQVLFPFRVKKLLKCC